MITIYTGQSRKIIRLIIPALLLFLAGACKKTDTDYGQPAVVQFYNALNDNVNLLVSLSDKPLVFYRTALKVTNKEFTIPNNVITLSQASQTVNLFAEPDTLAHDRPIISAALNVKAASTYSLFLYGTKATPAYELNEDHFPAVDIRGDSVTFIRFANFSEGQTISVNLKGEAPGSFIASLPFRSFSAFTKLPADRSVSEYEFEVRDEAGVVIIATYKTPNLNSGNNSSSSLLNPWIYKPNTLVLTGIPGGTGTNAQTIKLMSHRGQ